MTLTTRAVSGAAVVAADGLSHTLLDTRQGLADDPEAAR